MAFNPRFMVCNADAMIMNPTRDRDIYVHFMNLYRRHKEMCNW